jgi:hypothetical protein
VPTYFLPARMMRRCRGGVATASLAVGAAALTPAMANYDRCYENPATGCPGNYDVTKKPFHVASHSHKEAPFGQSR